MNGRRGPDTVFKGCLSTFPPRWKGLLPPHLSLPSFTLLDCVRLNRSTVRSVGKLSISGLIESPGSKTPYKCNSAALRSTCWNFLSGMKLQLHSPLPSYWMHCVAPCGPPSKSVHQQCNGCCVAAHRPHACMHAAALTASAAPTVHTSCRLVGKHDASISGPLQSGTVKFATCHRPLGLH